MCRPPTAGRAEPAAVAEPPPASAPALDLDRRTLPPPAVSAGARRAGVSSVLVRGPLCLRRRGAAPGQAAGTVFEELDQRVPVA
eukprot:11222420-Lingulodinium_polyedra.AAC.1